MSRTIEFRVDGGASQDTGSATQPVTVTGLTNDTEQDIEIRVVDGDIISPWSNIKAVTPTAPDVIEVGAPSGSDDTTAIDNAISDGVSQGKEVHFDSGVYNYTGSKLFSSDVTLVGTQPAYDKYSQPSATYTTIQIDMSSDVSGNHWDFDANITIEGIWLDANRTCRYPFRVLTGNTLTGNKMYLSGAYTDVNNWRPGGSPDSTLGAVVLDIQGTVTTDFTDCQFFDAQWDGDLTTTDAYPLVRVVESDAGANTLNWTRVQVFGCCDDLTLYSGTKLIESTQGLSGYTQDIDMMNLNGDGTTSTTRTWSNITLYDCPLSYIKASEGSGVWDVDGITFRTGVDKKTRGRMVRLQNDNNSGTGLQYVGEWANVVFDFDDPADRVDSATLNSTVYERALIQMSGGNTDMYDYGDGYFKFTNVELKWTGTLEQPVFVEGRSRSRMNRVKIRNVFGTGTAKYLYAVYKRGWNQLQTGEPNDQGYLDFIECQNANIGDAWILDMVETSSGSYDAFDGTDCLVHDVFNVKKVGSFSFDPTSIGVESDGDAVGDFDIYIANHQGNWQTAESCFDSDIKNNVRLYREY